MLRSVILASATLVLAAQTPAPEASKPTTPATAKAAPAAKKSAPAPDPVLATVGIETIRQSDFELFLETTLTEQQRLQLQFVEGARERYLTQFLEFKVLAAKAGKLGLQKNPEFAKKLKIMEMQLRIQALLEKDGPALQAKLNVSDDDVKAYF